MNAARNIGDFLGIRPSNYNYTVKRVIAVGGTPRPAVTQAGHVTVNGEPLVEPYIYEDFPFEAGTLDCATEQRSLRCFVPVQVPTGSLLMLGDHRSNSADSAMGCRGQAVAANCARFIGTDQAVARSCSPCCHHTRFAELAHRPSATRPRTASLPRSLALLRSSRPRLTRSSRKLRTSALI